MKPPFAKHIVTAPLTMEDAEILEGLVSVDGVKQTKAQILNDKLTRRIIATRNIMTGEMGGEDKTCSRLPDGSPLPFYVVSVDLGKFD